MHLFVIVIVIVIVIVDLFVIVIVIVISTSKRLSVQSTGPTLSFKEKMTLLGPDMHKGRRGKRA